MPAAPASDNGPLCHVDEAQGRGHRLREVVHVDYPQIASVPDIDALTLGPTDLAQDLGVLGTHAQREVLDEHRRRLVAAARKHGKAVAMLTDSVEGVRQMIAVGATIINYGSDAAVLRSGYASVVEEIRRGPSAAR